MKIKNTAPGGRGFGVGGNPLEWAAGETKDVPDDVIKDARRMDPVVEGWFADGTFVVEAGRVAAAPAKDDAKAKGDSK